MKKYYDKLTKEEKSKVKEEYLKSEECLVYKKASKIIIFCIVGLVIAVGSFIFDYIYKMGTLNYVLDSFLFIFSVIVLLRMLFIKKDLLNKYALSKKKK